MQKREKTGPTLLTVT